MAGARHVVRGSRTTEGRLAGVRYMARKCKVKSIDDQIALPTEWVPLDCIEIPANRREFDEATVDSLVISIRDIGLLGGVTNAPRSAASKRIVVHLSNSSGHSFSGSRE
jgi:hypothetical protein